MADLKELMEILQGNAEPLHTQNTRGQQGAAVGIPPRSNNTLTQQHSRPLPWVQGHPVPGCPQEEPLLAQAPLVLRICAGNI